MTLPTFAKGQKLKAADLQALVTAVRANRILPGTGIRVTGSPNGTTISANIPRAAGTTTSFCELAIAAFKDGETWKISVGWGRVAGMQPAELSPGGTPVYSFTASGSGYIYGFADWDWDSLQWTEAHIGNGSEVPANTETRAHALIGSWGTDASGNVIARGVCGAVGLSPCQLAEPSA